jgi:cytochrome c oxidase subunit III
MAWKPILAEHFEDFERQDYAGRLGMWLFLGSEAMLFAGLFALYAVYRVMYGEDFLHAQGSNDPLFGTINTVILISSSFTVAWAIHSVRTHKPKGTVTALIGVTLLGGVGFLVVKSFEYADHFHHGIFPGKFYNNHDPSLNTFGAMTFFTLYYFMTGLHVIHVLAGMIVLLWLFVRSIRHGFHHKHHLGLELGGLYWHLVDLVWIFLWPLLYLTGLPPGVAPH